jgi:succinate dehydrogenase cytochrome b subunit
MTVLVNFLKSSILSKVVMAVTGVLLVGFIFGHMLGNLQMFMGQDQMNTYAEKLQGLGSLLWAIRGGLIVILLLHVATSLYLKKLNYDARPVKYVFKNTVVATLASRTMLYSGLVIFFFLLYHLLHFTGGIIQPDEFKTQFVDALGRPDVYTMVILGFQNVLISIVYTLAMVFLGFHLSHSISSMFQTLGINHSKYNPIIKGLGPTVAIVIVVGYLSIAFSILFGIVKLPEGVM